MIGTLLCYALYPLSRYLTGRPSVSGVRPAAEEEAETGGEPQQERTDALKPEGREITIHPGEQNTEDENIFPTEDISPEQTLLAQLECLQTEDDAREPTCPVKGKMHMQSSGEPATPAMTGEQETEESATAAEAKAERSECWDECVAPAADAMHGGGIFASPPSDFQSHFNLGGHQDAQSGWHFPAGPGLAQEVQCPLVQFPHASYYPPAEPFDVMWRVWDTEEGAPAAETTPAPFESAEAAMNFTVMSYNILADDLLLANQELYTHCPLEVLDWSYRCSLLLDEILKWSPDILCLQEVQESHYHEQLRPVLSQMGYTCVYKRRTGTKSDGCATCYRGSCFSEVSVTLLEFFRPEMELLDRHNVGIVLLLRPVVTQGPEVKVRGPPLCVANTHLLFNPRRGDVKLAQLAIMLAEIDRVVRACRAKGEHCNLILCGDFNSVPHMPLYQLVTTGELHFQGLPAWMVSGQEDLSYKTYCHRLFAPLWPPSLGITDSCQYTSNTAHETVESQKPGKCQFSHDFLLQLRFCPAACVRPHNLELIPGVTDNTPDASRGNQNEKRFRHALSHRLNLESVYKHVLPGSGNPEVTTLHCEGGATVDYIFYSPRRISTADQRAGGDFVSEGLKLMGSLSLLSEDVLWSMKGLPNHRFPSDHLSLLAKFQLELNTA